MSVKPLFKNEAGVTYVKSLLNSSESGLGVAVLGFSLLLRAFEVMVNNSRNVLMLVEEMRDLNWLTTASSKWPDALVIPASAIFTGSSLLINLKLL